MYTILALSFLAVLTIISFTGFFKKNINGDGAGGKEITKDGGSVDSEVLFFVELDSSEGISDS